MMWLSQLTSSDGWLGDTLDVVAQDLAMTLRTTLAEALAAFSTCSGISISVIRCKERWVLTSSHGC